MCPNVCQEPPIIQGSNLEMVDRCVFGWVPDILDTSKLKHGTFRLSGTSRKCVRNHLSFKDPTWRWWIGVFLMDFLTYYTPENGYRAPSGNKEPPESASGTTCPPKIQKLCTEVVCVFCTFIAGRKREDKI